MKILFWFMVVLIFVNYCKTTEKSQKKEIKKVEIRCEKEIPMRYHYDTETGDILEKGPIILPQNLSCDQARKLPENEIMKFQRDGYWYLYHLGGKVMAEGMNKKNKREGEWKFYDEKGNLIKIILYSDGKKNGKEIGYFAGTNIVRYEGQNQDNKKVGLWKEYSDPTHQCITQGNYVDDMKTGDWIECNYDERTKDHYVFFKGRYVKNLRDGMVETYYPNGKLLSKGAYKADLGCKENPPPEGEKACEKKVGKWLFYFPNGNLMEEGNYDENSGKRIGIWREYYQTGELRAQGNREHTRKDRWTFYTKDGDILAQFDFQGNDFMASYCVEYQQNKKTAEGPCTAKMVKYEMETDSMKISPGMKQGRWKGYHPNGKLAWEGEILMGKRQGPWKIYDEIGRLIEEGEYNMDKKTGIWKEWENGKFVQKEYDMFGRIKNVQ